jgi:hypothetical protein
MFQLKCSSIARGLASTTCRIVGNGSPNVVMRSSHSIHGFFCQSVCRCW